MGAPPVSKNRFAAFSVPRTPLLNPYGDPFEFRTNAAAVATNAAVAYVAARERLRAGLPERAARGEPPAPARVAARPRADDAGRSRPRERPLARDGVEHRARAARR